MRGCRTASPTPSPPTCRRRTGGSGPVTVARRSRGSCSTPRGTRTSPCRPRCRAWSRCWPRWRDDVGLAAVAPAGGLGEAEDPAITAAADLDALAAYAAAVHEATGRWLATADLAELPDVPPAGPRIAELAGVTIERRAVAPLDVGGQAGGMVPAVGSDRPPPGPPRRDGVGALHGSASAHSDAAAVRPTTTAGDVTGDGGLLASFSCTDGGPAALSIHEIAGVSVTCRPLTTDGAGRWEKRTDPHRKRRRSRPARRARHRRSAGVVEDQPQRHPHTRAHLAGAVAVRHLVRTS